MYARLLATFCILATFARSSSLEPEPARVVVYLQIEKQNELSPGTKEALRREVSKQLSFVGFHVDWWDAHVTGAVTDSNLVVAKLKGSCVPPVTVSTGRRADAGGGKLATSRLDGNQIQPFIAVDCNLVSDFLGLSLHGGGERDVLYGRALGKLMSHELYHVLARTAKHSKTGIARENVTAQELLSNDFDFDVSAASLLQAVAMEGSVEDPKRAEE